MTGRLAAARVSAAFSSAGRVRHGLRGHVHVVLRRHGHVVVQLRLLQAGVVAHVDGSLLAAHHHRIGPGEGAGHRVDGGGLGVPLDVVADGLALHAGRVDPVDERAPLGLLHGAGGAHDEDGRPVEIGVVDAHGRVQQPHQVVDDGDHRLAAGAGVAVGDLHRDLLVVAQHHGRVVLAVVHQRVVKAPVAGAGIERDVLEPVALDHVDDDVRLPLAVGLLDRRRSDLFRCAHVFSLFPSPFGRGWPKAGRGPPIILPGQSLPGPTGLLASSPLTPTLSPGGEGEGKDTLRC